MKQKLIKIIIATLMLITILNVHPTVKTYETKPISISANTCKTIFDDYDVDVSCDENHMTVYPYENAVYSLLITNTGDMVDTYVLDCPDLIDCCYWSSLTTYELTLYPDTSDTVILTVILYWELEETYTITVRATSITNPTICDSIPTYTTVILGDRIIDVATDKAVYETDETVLISLTNIGDETIEGNPTFEVFDENNELVWGCYPDCWIPIKPGENFTCPWDPEVPEGKYIAEGWFLTYNGTFFDNATFFILHDSPIEVTTDKFRYESGENVTLFITNIGNSKIGGNPSFDIFNRNGDIVFSLYIFLWIELEPGEYFSWLWDQKNKHGELVFGGRYRLEGHFSTGPETYVDNATFYITGNSQPNPPVITGPISGKKRATYEYNITITDPDGDDLLALEVDFGDGAVEQIIPGGNSWESGDTIKVSHTWMKSDYYLIQARVIDEHGAWSDWGTLEVNMPKNKTTNPRILERLTERFPLIAKLLQLPVFEKLLNTG